MVFDKIVTAIKYSLFIIWKPKLGHNTNRFTVKKDSLSINNSANNPSLWILLKHKTTNPFYPRLYRNFRLVFDDQVAVKWFMIGLEFNNSTARRLLLYVLRASCSRTFLLLPSSGHLWAVIYVTLVVKKHQHNKLVNVNQVLLNS